MEGKGRLNDWARKVHKDELVRKWERIGRGRKVQKDELVRKEGRIGREGRLNEWAMKVQKDELVWKDGRIGMGRKVKWLSNENTVGLSHQARTGRKDNNEQCERNMQFTQV